MKYRNSYLIIKPKAIDTINEVPMAFSIYKSTQKVSAQHTDKSGKRTVLPVPSIIYKVFFKKRLKSVKLNKLSNRNQAIIQRKQQLGFSTVNNRGQLYRFFMQKAFFLAEKTIIQYPKEYLQLS
jgi:hypothetical protein